MLKYGRFILRRTGGTCCLASSISVYWRQMLVAMSPHIPICDISGQRPTGEINSIEIYPSTLYSLTYLLLLLGAQKSMLHCSCLLGQHTYTLPTKCRASVWGFRPRAAVSWWQFYSAWSLSFRHMARARNLVPFATQWVWDSPWYERLRPGIRDPVNMFPSTLQIVGTKHDSGEITEQPWWLPYQPEEQWALLLFLEPW